jgi:hypothetical protein
MKYIPIAAILGKGKQLSVWTKLHATTTYLKLGQYWGSLVLDKPLLVQCTIYG